MPGAMLTPLSQHCRHQVNDFVQVQRNSGSGRNSGSARWLIMLLSALTPAISAPPQILHPRNICTPREAVAKLSRRWRDWRAHQAAARAVMDAGYRLSADAYARLADDPPERPWYPFTPDECGYRWCSCSA